MAVSLGIKSSGHGGKSIWTGLSVAEGSGSPDGDQDGHEAGIWVCFISQPTAESRTIIDMTKQHGLKAREMMNIQLSMPYESINTLKILMWVLSPFERFTNRAFNAGSLI